MKISIVDRQENLSKEGLELTQRRLHFALSRFDSVISRVSVVVADLNGPRGGVDKTANITVRLRHLPEIQVSGEGERVEIALSRAAERAQRAVSRAVDRSHQFSRPEPHLGYV
ncbi:MAG: hypothetical protein R3C01_01825 [Planctomycetaceae bacterium]